MKTGIFQKVSMLAVSAFLFSSVSTMMAAESAQPANTIDNPGFEEGVKSWSMSSPVITICDSVFHEGNYSASIKCKGEGKNLYHISRGLPLPPAGSKVDCSVWVKTSKPELEYQVYFDITAQKEGGSPEWFAGQSSDIQRNPNGEWKEVKFSFTFPGDQTDKSGNIKKMCGFYFRLATVDKNAGEIWFDDASVVVTPPAAKDTAK